MSNKISIMVTSLYKGTSGDAIDYYYVRQGERSMYCDAMLSAEASCKYVLANHKIDEIFTFGTKSTHDEGDELVPIVLREGKSFYASDTAELSTYSLLRYRLAQFVDEIEIEKQELRDGIDAEDQEKVTAFLKNFFREKVNHDGNYRYNRFFEMLTDNDELWKELQNSLVEHLGNPADYEKYCNWARHHLYDEMRDSSKMEELDSNDDVRIRFIPLDSEGKNLIVDSLVSNLKAIAEMEDGQQSEIELYLAIQSDDARDNTILMNFIEAVRTMPGSNINIVQISTTSRRPYAIANRLSDDTDKFGVNELLAGARSFIKYGKTDILIDYWNKQGIHNEYIESLLYAMRNIDIGISLCDISDIERGIERLRRLFKEEKDFEANSFVEKFFNLIIIGLLEDYGRLLETEEPDFIDLVKWAYRKGFWQQTLTLIESRAPGEFVSKGIYHYCDSAEKKDEVVKKLGKIYFDLKPFEKFKMDDPSHYFVKYYGRFRAPKNKNSKVYQRGYAKIRTADLDSEAPDVIRAYSLCPDRAALEDLLFSYYYIGDVRNATNHAINENDGITSALEDSDISERMNAIKQAIAYFIQSFDKVCKLIEENGAENHMQEISLTEIVEHANVLIAEFKASRHNRHRRDRRDNRDNKGNRDFGDNNQYTKEQTDISHNENGRGEKTQDDNTASDREANYTDNNNKQNYTVPVDE